MKLFFVRHGQGYHNVRHIINENNLIPIKLTPKGESDVKLQAQHLKKIAPKLDFVYASPLIRTQQTARIICDHYADKKLQIITEPRIREIQTGFNNKHVVLPFAFFKLGFRKRHQIKFGKGQTIEHQAQLIKSFLEDLIKQHPNKTVLVVGHLFTYQMLCYLLKTTHANISSCPIEKMRLDQIVWNKKIVIPTSEIAEFSLTPKTKIVV